MLAWFISPIGQAVSTWLSNLLSLIAIGIGVIVALIEQRRAIADRAREQGREIEAIERLERDRLAKRSALIGAILNIIDEALIVVTTDLPEVGHMYTSWRPDIGKPLALKATQTSLETLRLSAVGDVDLILTLNRAVAAIEATIKPAHLDTAPRVEQVLHMLSVNQVVLQELRNRIATYAEDAIASPF